MRALLIVVCVAVSCLVTIAVTNVCADEECVAGYRDITPAEEAAMKAVLEQARRALPSVPDGWVVNSDEDLYVQPQICRDHELEPRAVDFSRRFLRVDDLEQREGALKQAGADLTASMAAKQPRMDAIMARIQDLSTAAVAAAQAGDYAKVDEINVEIEQASAEMESLMNEGGALDQADAANAEANRDTNIDIRVQVNSSYLPIGYGAEKVNGPAGAKGAYRWNDTSYRENDVAELVLFGRWRTDEDSAAVAPASGLAPTVVQGVAVLVTADASRIQSILDAIDFPAIAALVAPSAR